MPVLSYPIALPSTPDPGFLGKAGGLCLSLNPIAPQSNLRFAVSILLSGFLDNCVRGAIASL
ncbi:MAG: hypothetical protein HC881_14435 [Leptolyngbyaceae cyanobacterium SL_7_1]|nr:hypothetical protein [Leptolyngbyaceae cyanobacterium SL_7_1]